MGGCESPKQDKKRKHHKVLVEVLDNLSLPLSVASLTTCSVFFLTHLNPFFSAVLCKKVIFLFIFPSHSPQTLYPCLLLLFSFNCSFCFPSTTKLLILQIQQLLSKNYLHIYIFEGGSDTVLI